LFQDQESGENGVLIVRAAPGVVALCLSLERNGDTEALLPETIAEQLALLLTQAVRESSDGSTKLG
jgi:hypothetical protein